MALGRLFQGWQASRWPRGLTSDLAPRLGIASEHSFSVFSLSPKGIAIFKETQEVFSFQKGLKPPLQGKVWIVIPISGSKAATGGAVGRGLDRPGSFPLGRNMKHQRWQQQPIRGKRLLRPCSLTLLFRWGDRVPWRSMSDLKVIWQGSASQPRAGTMSRGRPEPLALDLSSPILALLPASHSRLNTLVSGLVMGIAPLFASHSCSLWLSRGLENRSPSYAEAPGQSGGSHLHKHLAALGTWARASGRAVH